MTTATYRPAGYSGDWGASPPQKLSDEDDATFVTGLSPYAYLLAEFQVNSLPWASNIAIKWVTARARMRTPSGPNWAITLEAWGVEAGYVGYHPVWGQGGSVQVQNTASNVFQTLSTGAIQPVEFTQVGTGAAVYLGIHPTIRYPSFPTDIDISELYLDVVYALPPTTTVTAPTGTYTDRSNPTISWTHTVNDGDGGAQTAYQVVVYDTATFSSGGFSPGVTAGDWTSGIVGSSLKQVTLPIALVNDTYRAYVRTAQSINGQLHWAAWAFSGFVINVSPPTTPTITPTGDNTNARMKLSLAGSGAATAVTVLFEVQRSNDNGVTWVPVRGEIGLYVAAVGGTRIWYDYESGNGESVKYRVRTHSLDISNNDIPSAWSSASSAVSWVSSSSWLKVPLNPELNRPIVIKDLGDDQYPVARSVSQGLGSTDTVVTRGLRRTKAEGTLTLYTATDSEAAALRALLNTGAVLLVQPRSNVSGWVNRYIDVGTIANARIVQLGAEPSRYLEMPYVERAAPSLSAFTLPNGFITWGEVLGIYANWLAIENGNVDWSDLRQ